MLAFTNRKLAAQTKAAGAASKYNVVVVGGGTSGCLIASRLAMDGLRVLLVEKGEDTTTKPRWHSLMPAGKQVHRILKSGYEDSDLHTVPQRHYTGEGALEPVAMPVPKVLGGSGVVGGRSWIRGPASDWEGTPWDYFEDLAPQLKHFEAVFNAPLHRGKHGKFLISRPQSNSPYYLPFSDAMIAQKIPFVIDFNPKDAKMWQGFGRPDVAVNANDGTSTSTLLQNVVEAKRHRYPITVLANATVTKLEGSDGTITGVSITKADGSTQIVETESVVVAGGAVRSAELLLQSKEAIPNLPSEVGANLWDSPVVVIQYKSKAQDTHHLFEDRLVQLIERMRWQRGEINSISSSYDDMTCFYATTPQGPIDARITIQPFAMDAQGRISGAVGGHGVQLRVELCKPHSRGSVSLENGAAVVDPAYYSDERDQKVMQAAVAFTKAVASSPSMGRLCKDTPVVELLESSCKSGGTIAAITCIDPSSHRVNGTSNVYACGSSVLPNPIIGDHLPFSLAFADRFSDMYLNKKAKLRIPVKEQEPFFERSIAAPHLGSGGTKEKVKVTYY